MAVKEQPPAFIRPCLPSTFISLLTSVSLAFCFYETQSFFFFYVVPMLCACIFHFPFCYTHRFASIQCLCAIMHMCVCTLHWVLCLTGAGKRVLSLTCRLLSHMNIRQGEEGWGHQRSRGFGGPRIRVQGFPQPSLTIGQEGRSVQAAGVGQAVTRGRTELHGRDSWGCK